MLNGNNLAATIDKLGVVKAQLAELKQQENDLKQALIELGVGAYEGTFFRATVSESERATLDMDAVREKLSPQFIAAHTNVTQVTTVRVVSRNGRQG